MFDRFLTTNVKSPEVMRVNVDMPRPDTAEFTRLANDMRREAEREVASTLVKKYGATNTVNVVEVRSENVAERGCSRARVVFKLNDELYDTDFFDFETDVVSAGSRKAVEMAVLEEIMKQVALTLRRKL